MPVTMRELLEAGVHFGHQTRRWNPKMRRFIFGERGGIYIIDLQKTLESLEEAESFVRNLGERGGTVLFVGTKKQAQDSVEEEAKRTGMPYVNHRWLGGLLTNWRTISERIEHLHELRRLRDENQLELLPPKERISMQNELEKLEANLGGVADMRKQPDAIFIVDLRKEQLAVREARRLGMPVIALVDTNCDPDEADFVIPGNDDAIRSCSLIVHALGEAIAEGKQRAKPADFAPAPAEETQPGAGAGGSRGARGRSRARAGRRAGAGARARSCPRHAGGGVVSQVQISASLVKELRDRTGAGMMAAKRALEETGGDVEAAQRLLREQGMAAAGKKAGRATTEGEVLATVSGNVGAIVAVGCETEPVSKNEEFLSFAEAALEAVEANGPEALEGLEERRLELIAKIGENVELVGGTRMEAGEGELLAEYVHPPANKIGVLVRVKGSDGTAARRLAMHISFAAPRYRSVEEVPAEELANERSIYENQADVQSKPEEVRAKIVEGRLRKEFLSGVALSEQAWIHDPSLTAGKALEEAGLEVLEFVRYALAE